MAGVLDGVKVLELGGLGPGPFCGMLLADMGADVVVIDRGKAASEPRFNLFNRNKRSILLDLKKPGASAAILDLVTAADMMIDPFRPGVTDRLGIGPKACMARNPRLVYGQITGWGQDGPLAQAAGRDLNYIALTGALAGIGTPETPVPPLNLVGDYGGGALYLLTGLLAAHLHAVKTGIGQVVDVAMCDGAASLMTGTYGYLAEGRWNIERGANFIDGGAAYYNVYPCCDGKFISIAAIDAGNYADLLKRIGLAKEGLPEQYDKAEAKTLRERLAAVFVQRSRQEWCDLLEGTDVCFAPVLTMDEAPEHSHMKARNVFLEIDGVTQPAPAPRFMTTPSEVRYTAPTTGANTEACLFDWGVDADVIALLRKSGAIST